MAFHTEITRQGDNPDCCRMLRMSKLRAVWERIEVRIGSIAIIQSIMQLGRVEVHGICWIWELHCLVSLVHCENRSILLNTKRQEVVQSVFGQMVQKVILTISDMFFNIQVSQKVDFTLVLKSCRSSLGPVLKWPIPYLVLERQLGIHHKTSREELPPGPQPHPDTWTHGTWYFVGNRTKAYESAPLCSGNVPLECLSFLGHLAPLIRQHATVAGRER